ncbi:hypothetical protein [Leptospirillum ferriphilum]|nr:hypothetical protein [Leptospirillum ferriphilum]
MYLEPTPELIEELEREGIDVIHPDELGAFDLKNVEGDPDNGEE